MHELRILEHSRQHSGSDLSINRVDVGLIRTIFAKLLSS